MIEHRWVKSILGQVGGLKNPSSWVRTLGMPLLLPFYHTVSDEALPHIHQLYKVKRIETFEQELNTLLRYYEPISIKDIVERIRIQKSFDRPVFHLTFDDGLRECYEVIAPILRRRGVSASFFINPAFVDNGQLFYKHQISVLLNCVDTILENQKSRVTDYLNNYSIFYQDLKKSILHLKHHQQNHLQEIAALLAIDFEDFLKTQQPYMTFEQIQSLHEEGFHIGAHSWDHPMYQELDLGQQLEQTRKSLEYVNEHFPSEVRSFAFPFYSDLITERFFEALSTELDISFGTSGVKLDQIPNHLHRFPMEKFTINFERELQVEYLAYWVKQRARRGVLKRF